MDPLLLDGKMDTAALARAIREQKKKAAEDAEAAKLQAERAEKAQQRKALLEKQKKYGAANSHVLNDKYMADFDKAWEELMAAQGGDSSLAGDGVETKGGKAFLLGPPAKPPGKPETPGSALAKKDGKAAMSEARTRNIVNTAKATGQAGFVRHPPAVLDTWRTGPEDPAGKLADISDRPSMCSAANWAKGEIVVGSSDHALYVIDAEKGTKKRQLYNKTSGHQEWVTACCYTPDGKIVSGGMDSRMWMWPAGTTRGILMEGHSAPISKLEYDAASGLVVSASYDKTVRMWQCGSRGQEMVCLAGHEAPVMELGVGAGAGTDGKMISGDRSGHIILWDTSASDVSWRMKNVHKGHVSALAWCDGEDPDIAGLFVSGGQDGYVRVWDPRERKNPAKIQLHVNKEGRGAVSAICAGGAAAANMVVTCGADMTLRVLDPRKSFALMSTVELTNFPYAMGVAGGLALVGCGDGALLVVDIKEGKILYGMGAHKGAVRCIEACQDRLFTSGDDGNTMLWKYGASDAS